MATPLRELHVHLHANRHERWKASPSHSQPERVSPSAGCVHHALTPGVCDSQRMLRECDESRGHDHLPRLMREHGPMARQRARFHVTTYCAHPLPVASDVCERPVESWAGHLEPAVFGRERLGRVTQLERRAAAAPRARLNPFSRCRAGQLIGFDALWQLLTVIGALLALSMARGRPSALARGWL